MKVSLSCKNFIIEKIPDHTLIYLQIFIIEGILCRILTQPQNPAYRNLFKSNYASATKLSASNILNFRFCSATKISWVKFLRVKFWLSCKNFIIEIILNQFRTQSQTSHHLKQSKLNRDLAGKSSSSELFQKNCVLATHLRNCSKSNYDLAAKPSSSSLF